MRCIETTKIYDNYSGFYFKMSNAVIDSFVSFDFLLFFFRIKMCALALIHRMERNLISMDD